MQLKIYHIITLSISLLFGNFLQGQSVYVYSGSPETYTVPAGVFSLEIECKGAQGGDGQNASSSPGGWGAYMKGDFSVTPGETLTIIVGESGGDGVSAVHGGGGGGGSFVIRNIGNVPLIIAAGGGGGCKEAGSPGAVGNSGINGGAGGYSLAAVGEGGITDNGGNGGNGAGGGGWLTSGNSNNWADGGELQGGSGGSSLMPFIDGGFGGGGAGFHGGGGGGGYTGGSGGDWFTGAGGGGSYNIGTNQLNGAGTQSGNGMITITPTCSPLVASPNTSVELCEGTGLSLNATSSTGGTVSWSNGIQNGVSFNPPAGTTIYTATSSNTSDCPHSITVITEPSPQVIANASATGICLGDQLILTGSGADIYNWAGGIIDGVPITPGFGSTIYYVTGQDTATNCQATDEILVDVSDPSATYISYEEIWGNDGAIDVTMTNGATPYTFDWDNDGTGDNDDNEDLFGLGAGVYNLVATDNYGCVVMETILIGSQLSVESEALEINIYPVPATDILTIQLEGNFEIILCDLNGKHILNKNSSDKCLLDVSAFSAGTYILQVTSSTQIFEKRVIVH